MGWLKSLCMAGAIVAAAPAFANTIPYDRSFTGSGVSWRGGGSTTVFFKVFESGGKTMVCGLYFNKGAVPGIVPSKLLRGSRVRVGNTTLMNNLVYFTEVAEDSDASKARAQCKASRKPWKAGYDKKPALKLPSGPVEF